MSEAQLQRLEKESERFAKEIKQKEAENESLREQIVSLQQRVTETKASFDEIATGRNTAVDQNQKMRRIQLHSRLHAGNDSRAKEIARLRSHLKQLRMKTFPRFAPPT